MILCNFKGSFVESISLIKKGYHNIPNVSFYRELLQWIMNTVFCVLESSCWREECNNCEKELLKNEIHRDIFYCGLRG